MYRALESPHPGNFALAIARWLITVALIARVALHTGMLGKLKRAVAKASST